MQTIFVELLKEQSNSLNRECQQFQTEIKSIIHAITQEPVIRDQLNRVCDDFSTTLNKICIDYLIKFEANTHIASQGTKPSSFIKKPSTESSDISSILQYHCGNASKGSLARHNRKKHSFSDNNSERSVSNMSSFIDSDDDSVSSSDSHDSDASTSSEYKCDKCGRKFKTHHALGGHKSHCQTPLKEDLKVSVTVCTICHKHFSTAYRLKEHHLQVHTTERPFKCDECPKDYKLQRFLHAHIRDDHNGYPWKCNECDEGFRYFSELRTHIRETHNGTTATGATVECNDCDKTFKDKLELNRHRNRMHSVIDQNPLKCDICDKVYASVEMLDVHKLTHMFVCEYCSIPFKQQRYLTRHIITVHDKDPWKCGGCGETFRMKRDLRKHIKTIHQLGAVDVETNGNDAENNESVAILIDSVNEQQHVVEEVSMHDVPDLELSPLANVMLQERTSNDCNSNSGTSNDVTKQRQTTQSLLNRRL